MPMTDKRTKEIKIRLTDSEHKMLLDMAGNQQLATFMREYCLSAEIGRASCRERV